MQQALEFTESLARKTCDFFFFSSRLTVREQWKDKIVAAPQGEVLVRKATNDEKWGESSCPFLLLFLTLQVQKVL